MTAVDPLVAGTIAAMAVGTYATKAGGLWLLGRVSVTERTEAALEALPGAIVVSILGPELAAGGPAEWTAGALVVVVVVRTENVLLALAVGVAAVVLLRGGA